MAINMATATTIYGRTVGVNLTSTNMTQVLSNADSSGALLKINSIMVSNVDGATNAEITVVYYDQAALAGTGTEIAKTVVVPVDATVIVMDRSTGIYLAENSSIGAQASAANDLKVICSYEEIS